MSDLNLAGMGDIASTFGGPMPDAGPLAQGMIPQNTAIMQTAPEDASFQRKDSVGNHLLYGPPGVVAGFFQTVGQSVHLLDPDATEHYFKGTEFGDYYSRNRDALQTIGDLGGMFIPGIAASKLVAGGGWLSRVANLGLRGLETSPEAFARFQVARETGSKVLGGTFADAPLINKVFTSGQETGQKLALLEAKYAQTAKATGQVDWGLASNMRDWNRDASTLIKTNMWDSIKENVAFEFGVFATMNQSETLYPSEWNWSDYAAFQIPLPAAGVIASRIYTKGQIAKLATRLGEVGYASRFPDPEEIGAFSGVSRPGNRGMVMAFANDTKAHAVDFSKTQLDDYKMQALLNTNMHAQVTSLDQVIKTEAERLGQDSVLPGITSKFDFGQEHLGPLKDFLNNQKYGSIGALSFEGMPTAGSGYAGTQILDKQEATIKKLHAAYKEIEDEIQYNQAVYDGWKVDELTPKLLEARKAYQNARDASVVTIDSGGIAVPAAERPLLAQDFMGQKNIINGQGDILSPGTISLRSSEDVKAGSKLNTFYTIDLGTGHITMPETTNITMLYEGQQFFAGKNVTQLITGGQAKADAIASQLKILHDIAEDWGINGARFKSEVAQNLLPETRDALKRWTGTSNSQIRDWTKRANAGDAQAQKYLQNIWQANEPGRTRLKELANLRGGTIQLYRGVGEAEAKGTSIPQVASYSASFRVASNFGSGNVIQKEIDPNDVLAIVEGLKGEYEYIVRNNQQRALPGIGGETGQKITKTTQTIANPQIEFSTLDTAERSKVYYLGENFVNQVVDKAERGKLEAPIFLDPAANSFQAGLAVELGERLGNKFNDVVKLPEGMDLDKAQMHLLNHAYGEYRTWQDVEAKLVGGAKEDYDKYHMSATQFRYHTNLPHPGIGKSDSILELFNAAHLQGDNSLFDFVKNLDDFKMALTTTKTAPDIVNPASAVIQNSQLRGKMLNWNPDKNRAFNVVYSGKMDTIPQNRQALMDLAAQQRMNIVQKFQQNDANGSMFAGIMLRNFKDTGHGLGATQIQTLGNGSQRGGGIVFQRNLANGDATAIRAADLYSNVTDKEGNEAIAALMRASGATALPAALKMNSRAQDEFNRFLHIKRQGFRTLGRAINADGGTSWVLDTNSKLNQDLWQRYFGEPLKAQENEVIYMPDTLVPRKPGEKLVYKPFGMNEELARDAADMNDMLGQQVYKENLALQDVAGRGKPNQISEWVPPINFANPNVAFIRDAVTGDGYTMLEGDTPQILRHKIQAAIEEYGKNKINIRVETPDVLATTYDLRDEAFTRMMNFSDPLAQTGSAKGTQAGLVYTTGDKPMQDLMNSYSSLFQSFMRRHRAALFEPYINQVRLLDASMAASPNAAKGTNVRPTQKWLNLIFSNPTLTQDSAIGKLYGSIERGFDDFLTAVQNKVSPAFGGRADTFADPKLADAANLNGFSDAMAAASNAVEVPEAWTFRKFAGQMNAITTNLALRMFNLGFPMMNMISLAATTPAVVKALQRGATEDFNTWLNRTGVFSTPVGKGPDSTHAVFNPLRAMITGWHEYNNATHVITDSKGIQRKVLARDLALQRGLTKPTMAELVETLVKPNQGPIAANIQKFVDKTSKVADMSESLSRAYAFFTGYGIAKHGYGMSNVEDMFAFASKFADDVVGDYRPNNRPEMFQGAVGMPLGLFTTFMWSYYQRLFRYVENKQTGALLTQLATQASLFGAKTVPGFSQYVNFFASNYDGSSNPVDGFRKRFGDEAADWFFYGLASNVPKMFGANDGIAVYTHGDAGFRMIPTVVNPQDIPAVNTLKKAYGAVSNILTAARDNGVSPKQIAEITAQYSISAPWRALVEAATGQSLDAAGRIVNNHVQTPLGIAARALGMRTLQEGKNIEAWQAIGDGQAARQQRMAELRDTVRYNLREGAYSEDNGSKLLGQNLRDYIERGGDPQGIAQWMRDQALASSLDRSQEKIIQIMKGRYKSPQDIEDTMKLIYSQMPLTNKDFGTPNESPE